MQSKQTYDKPRSVKLRTPTYEENLGTILQWISSLLPDVGRLEWWELQTDSPRKHMKVITRYIKTENAREAAQSLNDRPQLFLNMGKLNVDHMISATFKVLTKIYNAVRSDIEAENLK